MIDQFKENKVPTEHQKINLNEIYCVSSGLNIKSNKYFKNKK